MEKSMISKATMAAALAGVLLAVLAAGFQLCVRLRLDLKTTYVAARTIPPRTQIQESDLSELRIPSAYLLEHTVSEKAEILGKYTEIQGMIPAGSAFYKEMLFDETEIPDNPSTQLRSGQAAYSLETDLAKLGGTIVSGQRVDLYLSVDRREDNPLTGCVLRNVRVISIRDHKGLELSDAESTGTPYLAVLAVNQEDVGLLTLAEKIGSLRMFASNETYTSRESVRAEDSAILEYLYETGGSDYPATM